MKWIRSDEWLTLETSAFESLYGGQFTLSTQLMKPNYLVILPTDAVPQFRWKLTPLSAKQPHSVQFDQSRPACVASIPVGSERNSGRADDRAMEFFTFGLREKSEARAKRWKEWGGGEERREGFPSFPSPTP